MQSHNNSYMMQYMCVPICMISQVVKKVRFHNPLITHILKKNYYA